MMNRFISRSMLAFITLALACTFSESVSAKPPVKDSVDKDYSSELPRTPYTKPADAIATFQVAPGFRIQLVAAEPLVTDPIAMAFDENGRLFVVEMRGYSEDAKDNLGLIRLLEDTNGDGRMDRSSVYLDKLSWPTAVTCYDGGIFVGVAPDILYAKDTDGDRKADVVKKIFTGFGRSNVQGLLNTFKWGLDQRIHGATSSCGAQVRPADDPQAKAINLNGRDFAIDPRSLRLSTTSGGGQHGLSFDQWGNKFVCANSNHLQMVMFEDRYVARNPYLAAPSPRVSIAADGPQADVFRASPIEPWRIVRTRLRVQGLVPGPIERGGTPAGYFTGATGATIYRGNAWPRKYYGWAFIGDAGGNLIHRKRLDENGVGFIGHRVDEKREFLASRDIWFRPVQYANAPDGTLYVADMYREVIEHPHSLHPVIKKHLDLTSGRDRGRIYRVVPDGFSQPPLPRLGSAATAELVATLAHANGWHRAAAARLLYERRDRRAIGLLDNLAAKSKSPEGRIRAMYVLASLEALSEDVVLPRLDDPHPRVRQHAVRLAEQVAGGSPAIRQKLFSMVADDDPRVRYQLAFTLGELHGPRRSVALAALARRDGGDRWVRLAVFSSLGEGAGAAVSLLAADKKFRDSKVGLDWIKALAAQIGRQRRSEDVAAVLKLLRSLPATEKQLVQTILQGLAAKQGSSLEKQIAAATGGRASKLLAQMLQAARKTSADPEQPAAARVEAIHLLELGSFQDSRQSLAKLLTPAQPQPVQHAALSALATFQQGEVAALLVEAWPSFAPSTKSRASEVLFSRGEWLRQLLDAVQQGHVAVGDLEPGRLRLLASHPEQAIRGRAKKLAAKTRLGNRQDVLRAYQGALQGKGDPTQGKLVFKKNCAACHRLEGVGYEIGPNLAAMRNRGAEAILLNVLDPNREVNPQYVNYLLEKSDGRQLTGMVTAESATSVTLSRAEGASDTVLRIDIQQLKSTGMSLMPEGMEKEIDKQAMADLMAYLLGAGD